MSVVSVASVVTVISEAGEGVYSVVLLDTVGVAVLLTGSSVCVELCVLMPLVEADDVEVCSVLEDVVGVDDSVAADDETSVEYGATVPMDGTFSCWQRAP